MSGQYTPSTLGKVLDSSNIEVRDKRVLMIYPPTIECVEFVERAAQSVATAHIGYGGVGHYLAMKAAKETRRRFPRVLITTEINAYLGACDPQEYDVILLFDSSSNLQPQKTYLLAKRALAFNGQMLITTDLVRDFPAEPWHNFNDGHNSFFFHHWTKEPGFMIASYPRCGTHMLRTAIDKHPDLKCLTEVFNPTVADGGHGLNNVAKVTEAFWPTQKTGFCAHAYIGVPGGVAGLTAPRGAYSAFWENMPRGGKVISMRRRNLLDRHVSHLKAKQSLVWNQESGGPNKLSVHVNTRKLYQDVDYVKKCWGIVDTLHPRRLVVLYEDMQYDFEKELKRVHEYLGVRHVPAQPSTKKLGRSLTEDVSNFEQLQVAIKKRGGMKGLTL